MAHTRIINLPFHYGMKFSNQTLDWWSPDSEEQFQKNIQKPEFRDYFCARGWDKPGAIKYKFNQHGFRSPEFSDTEDTLMALGDSYTMGIGLPEEHTWPYLVGAALGLRHANFGWGGAAGDFCYRQAEYWIPKLKPKLVVFVNPPDGRLEIEIAENGKTDEISPILLADPNQYRFKNDEYIQFLYANYENIWRLQRKNANAIAGICAEYNIPFLKYTAMDWTSKERSIIGYARDAAHAGSPAHERIVEKIIVDFAKTKIT